ncbi:hypothetical protein [Methyloversatilis sp.]|uniref:hypothetical protein n=1 Tax=Methyloversatilis sp. TaxID=2569862 RepID=UPI0027369A6A|nr:hypothetical protein [Methyloversatilis sp.]MDP2869353.1 hypothetical protein [Methyloversatilis sp.]MDP3455191.1 hypothetical protein [Methyloversatilis sp.]MDP3579560.1 hypothetical protein [Methyloversatilis sp.]
MVNIGKIILNNKLAHIVDRSFQVGRRCGQLRETCMIGKTWGVIALSALFGFSLFGTMDNAYAARSVASSEQVKKKIRPAVNVAAKKRISATAKAPRRTVAVAAATPVFRPPKAPAQRHYAVDGSTFYADGVRVRAAGLEALETTTASSIGKQKLQQLLDSGRVSIEPLDMDDGEVTLARVRIDGKDLSELATMR